MEFPQEINNRTTICSSNPPYGYVSKDTEISILKDICTHKFIVALGTIALTWKKNSVPRGMNGGKDVVYVVQWNFTQP